MNRLMEYTVFSGFVIDWRFATWPTSRSPLFVIATTEGVVRAPSWLGITVGSPPCMTATTELVVPKSMPIILLIECAPVESSRAQPAAPGNETKAIIHVERVIVKLSVCLYSTVNACFTVLVSQIKRCAHGDFPAASGKAKKPSLSVSSPSRWQVITRYRTLYKRCRAGRDSRYNGPVASTKFPEGSFESPK